MKSEFGGIEAEPAWRFADCLRFQLPARGCECGVGFVGAALSSEHR
ncbi:hypothetical protein AB0D83_41670 [Streptomyces decoyicus]